MPKDRFAELSASLLPHAPYLVFGESEFLRNVDVPHAEHPQAGNFEFLIREQREPGLKPVKGGGAVERRRFGR